MKSKKSIQASLKILLLIEEFTNREIKDAIEMIESNFENNKNPLLSFLKSVINLKSSEKHSSKNKAIGIGCSRVILELEDTDKEKFLLLSKVDKLIREGKVLRKLNDIKKIANQISKEFPSVKSRKDAIPKFMALLANMSIDEAGNIVESIMQNQNSDVSESEYHELASFLIGGNK